MVKLKESSREPIREDRYYIWTWRPDTTNKYITEKEPWSKDIDEKEAEKIINNLSYLLRVVSEKYLPIIPISAQKGLEALKRREKIILFPRI